MSPSRRAATLARILDTRPWGGETPTLRLLGFEVVIRADDPVVTDALSELYAPMADDGPAEHMITFTEAPNDRYELHLDGARILATKSPAVAFSQLIWELNRQTIDRTAGRTLIHAAAVSRDQRAIVLAGPMGSGKSTLAAALLLSGFDYLTDEVVAIDHDTLAVDPYPKPISLGAGAGSVPPGLAALDAGRLGGLERYLGDHWLVAPGRVRSGCVGDRATIGAIVLPVYVPRAPARLEPISRPEAVLALAEHTFRLDAGSQNHLETLARVVAGATCHRLTSGDLDGAMAALRPLPQLAEPAG